MTASGTPTDAAHIAQKVTYRGHVQRVGFRYTVLDLARRHPAVTGYVGNLADGDVEIVAEGPAHEVVALLDEIAQGPHARHIRQAHIETLAPPCGHRGFTVAY